MPSMSTNLDRFRSDLKELIDTGHRLQLAIRYDCFPEQMEELFQKQLGEKLKRFKKDLPNFKAKYQRWYSEALALLRQLLPDRVSDFVRHYEKPKGRKTITFESYRIEDYFQGLTVTTGIYNEKVVGPDAAVPHFEQQLAIIQAAEARFESSLFEIRQLVQADLLDSELEAAEELAKHKFFRAAGAVAGVVLEKHLAQVCADHKVTIAKKHPTISDFNDALKTAGVIDVPQWRSIQLLADIRNLCDHGRQPDPTPQQVTDLLASTNKVIKTVY
jgi:hypothetical protein